MKKLIIGTLAVVVSAFSIVQATALAQEAVEPVACETDYVVQAGDWLSTIAGDAYDDVLTYPAIAVATNAQAAVDDTYATIANSGIIEEEWKLCLPSAEDVALIMASDEVVPFTNSPESTSDEDEAATEESTDDAAESTETTATDAASDTDAEAASSDAAASDTEATSTDSEATNTDSTDTESSEAMADTMEDLSLAGPVWTLTTYGSDTGRQAVASATVGFFPGSDGMSGRLSGSTGCNVYFTTYSVADEAMAVGPVNSSRILCTSSVMAQEQAFLAALQSVEAYRITGDTLEIIYDNGSGILTFAAQ